MYIFRSVLRINIYCVLLFGFANMVLSHEIKTALTTVSIDDKGYYTSITVVGQEVLEPGSYPIVSVIKDNVMLLPKKIEIKEDRWLVSMADNGVVELRVYEGNQAITYEVLKISKDYRMLAFGPIKVKLYEVVGEVVGVVQHGDIAFGMQSLNRKTNGGIPRDYAEIYSTKFGYIGENTDLSVESIPYYRSVAVDVKDGAVFQLSSRNRQSLEYRQVQQVDGALVLPVPGLEGAIEGSKIALFGDRRNDILARIGLVEKEFGLPHPIIEGEWDKISRGSMRSYLITNFSEDNLDFVLDKVKLAGFKNLYHPDPFKTWGHFDWNPLFTKHGDKGVRAMVDIAKAVDVHLGIHTLTNFLTTNDAYVTPVPSSKLLKQGDLTLTNNIDDSQTEIEILYSDLFEVPLTLNALQIGDELITFGNYEKHNGKIILLNCARGAFNTRPSRHGRNLPMYKLWDYPYKTLFPDLELQDTFASRLAEIFNITGIKQISFDGLEGSMYTGHDYYATARFVTEFYNRLNGEVRKDLINDASRLDHYLWHTHTRMNWGEPWGEEMRQGQVENRIKNQEYFHRNLFPRMLGWFLVRLAERRFEATSLEDLEWALSESAGFDAGYAMSINVKTLREHGQIDKLLQAMRNWDALRYANVFTDEQKKRLKEPTTEWHLEKIGDQVFFLYPLFISERFRCDLSEMQPGQPSGADWSWYAPEEGSYALRIKVEGNGVIANPSFTTPKGRLRIEGDIKADQYILLDHEGNATLTDQNYNLVRNLNVQGIAGLAKGFSSVAFSCDMVESQPEVVVRYIVRSTPEEIIIP